MSFDQLLHHPDLWRYASIPVVAAIVGWATNWVAIEMTFWPLEWKGLRPIFGWQGIIPSKAEKMAAIFVDKTMIRLGTLSEVFQRMDPEVIAEHVVQALEPRVDELTDEVMRRSNVVLWENLPEMVRNTVYQRVREELPQLVRDLLADVDRQVEELVDMKELVVGRLVEDRNLLNRLFLECGDAEFRFIVRSGFWFGGLFGLVQLAVWVFFPAAWVLPAFGLFVGLATNWIALNVIFRPLEPKKLGPWKVQGLFLRRQAEVADVWCTIVTRDVLTLRELVTAMLTGRRSDRTRSLIRKHIKRVVDRSIGPLRGLAQAAVGLRGFAGLKDTVGDAAVEVAIEPFRDRAFVLGRAEAVAEELRHRMTQLPPQEFQDLLRPCFQEDELKLVLLGGGLGLLAGLAQLQFVFGGW
ncbi:MAG TPA: hypothetical protein VKU40_04915 [Thermoanaerobaculia bacterium]|nr:hypothetical protein [Thermoanaerobaculia bacterium]